MKTLREIGEILDNREVILSRNEVVIFKEACKKYDAETLIKITNLASIDDTLWVKEENSTKLWKNTMTNTKTAKLIKNFREKQKNN